MWFQLHYVIMWFQLHYVIMWFQLHYAKCNVFMIRWYVYFARQFCILHGFSQRRSLHGRYVDDILAIVPTDSNETLLQHLNNQNPSIQFSFEKQTHSSLPFLDLQINRKNDGSLSFSIYRKPTFTGKQLDYHSLHPLSQKRSVASSLFKRATDLCS